MLARAVGPKQNVEARQSAERWVRDDEIIGRRAKRAKHLVRGKPKI